MPERARITERPSEDNGYYYIVDTSMGTRYFLRGFEVTGSPAVGTKGIVEYKKTPSRGYYYFIPDPE